jgi:hypothetical protein
MFKLNAIPQTMVKASCEICILNVDMTFLTTYLLICPRQIIIIIIIIIVINMCHISTICQAVRIHIFEVCSIETYAEIFAPS